MMHLLIITYLQIAFHPLSRSAAWRPGAGKAQEDTYIISFSPAAGFLFCP